MIVDAHQHFWQPSRGDYCWLTPDLKALYRDFSPDDLAPLLSQNGIDGTILVQAAPTIAETEFLLDLADKTSFILGVVGWADFESPTAADDIARLANHPKLVGLRPMIQDIPDNDWMLRTDLTPAFDAMIKADLTFDALVLPRHLSRLGELLSRHPKLRTVIDHAAKPEIARGKFDVWANEIAALAKQTSAYCKLSGLLTEAGENWTPADLAPYVTHLMETFGPQRLIWGSDWPVLTLATSFEVWMQMAETFMPNDQDRDSVFGTNALDLYRLS